MASTNRHIVDQLADVRAQIKALGEEEARLKGAISIEMGTADSLGGDEFIARQALSTRKGGIDDKKAKADGVDLDKYRKAPATVLTIRLERREREAA